MDRSFLEGWEFRGRYRGLPGQVLGLDHVERFEVRMELGRAAWVYVISSRIVVRRESEIMM